MGANDETSTDLPESAVSTTAHFEAITDVEIPGTPGATGQAAAAIDALPAGSALLVVQHGPTTGARFLLDADATMAATPARTSSSTTSPSRDVTRSSGGSRTASRCGTSAR